MKQHLYLDNFGKFDYDLYKSTQIKTNLKKLQRQWVSENLLIYLSTYIKNKLSSINFGLCHGTRRGLEQQIFIRELRCDVLGTEISYTANSFPATIQWDFHEIKPEWHNAVDFIYSNSWDHSYDAKKLLSSWFSCLRPGGICLLEHTEYHTIANEQDPLGLQEAEFVELIGEVGKDKYKIVDTLRDCPEVGFDHCISKPIYIVVQSIGK